jgi:radical S-adenosyl methionine domain-containing protein 2
LCDQYGIKFKLNSVINAYNWKEDMNGLVNELNPFRWKVFQVLVIEGENSGPAA